MFINSKNSESKYNFWTCVSLIMHTFCLFWCFRNVSLLKVFCMKEALASMSNIICWILKFVKTKNLSLFSLHSQILQISYLHKFQVNKMMTGQLANIPLHYGLPLPPQIFLPWVYSEIACTDRDTYLQQEKNTGVIIPVLADLGEGERWQGKWFWYQAWCSPSRQ